MALAMDIDNRKLNRIFKDNPNAFGMIPDPLATVSLRSDVADYIFEARVETLCQHTDMTREDAEKVVQEDLDKTESEEVL